MRTSPSTLQIDYPSLGEAPSERKLVLQSAVRLAKKDKGLYGRRNIQVKPEAWHALLNWVGKHAPDGLRREKSQIRILRRFDGHAIIGTEALVNDIGSDDHISVSSAPELDDIWRAARRVYASE